MGWWDWLWGASGAKTTIHRPEENGEILPKKLVLKPAPCPSCGITVEEVQCLGCGAKREANLWWYEEGGNREIMAKKKEQKRRPKEDYVFCPECETHVLKVRLQKDVFGNEYCPVCEKDIKEEKVDDDDET